MEIYVRDDRGMVEIWLNRQEQQDAGTDACVRNAAKDYHKKHYKVAVFRSGNADLFACTDGLLKANLRL
ncbi:MAG: hypothetical protein IJY85_00010 [Ruminococcus sp.]|nr:hypothetical protein [Ruminococcus sp.]